METIHLMDTEAEEEKALCGADALVKRPDGRRPLSEAAEGQPSGWDHL